MTEPVKSVDGLATWRATPVGDTTALLRGVDTFVRGAVLAQAVYAVVGADGIAAVNSPSDLERSTYLYWSHQAEASVGRMCSPPHPRIVAIDLPGFLSITLPEMAARGALAGVDSSAQPVEAELEARALAAHLREELTRNFAFQACKTRMVFMLESATGDVASVMSPDGTRITPVWADRQQGAAALAALGDPSLQLMRKPLLELTNRYLLSPEGVKAGSHRAMCTHRG